MATYIEDIEAASAGFRRGEPAYGGTGGGGVRTGDFYGWAALPRTYIEGVWGAAGFRLAEWIPSGVLFGQAMVGLVRKKATLPDSQRGRFRRLSR